MSQLESTFNIQSNATPILSWNQHLSNILPSLFILFSLPPHPILSTWSWLSFLLQWNPHLDSSKTAVHTNLIADSTSAIEQLIIIDHHHRFEHSFKNNKRLYNFSVLIFRGKKKMLHKLVLILLNQIVWQVRQFTVLIPNVGTNFKWT